MDYFSLFLNFFCLTAQGAMHIWFCGSLTRKRLEWRQFAAYLVPLFLLEWAANKASLPWMMVMGAELLVLYGVNRLALGNRLSESWAAAILACYISQLSFGLINSVEAMTFSGLIRTPLLYPMVVAATAVSFAVCAACCAAVVKSISPEDIGQIANVGCLLFPALFFFAAELYIMRTSYTYTQAFDSGLPFIIRIETVGRHMALLFLQALGLGALFCTLYAYRHLCRSLRVQAGMRSLAQAARAQKVYITEAQMRYEQTKAFRHDLKNHLSVLDGLLNNGRLEDSRAYLQKLKTASALLSFPYQTGNPVVDILLGEKLGLAKANGIAAEVSLLLPKPCGIDDFDLCVIFANALDNAVCACQSVEGEKSIRISGERQGDFYRLAFENTCSDGPVPPAGTGLSNIQSVVEKYHGAMLTEKAGGRFLLNVLLNISLPPEHISIQKP